MLAAAADRFLVMGDQYSLIMIMMIMIVQAVTETCVSGDTAGLREPTVTEDWPREEASNRTAADRLRMATAIEDWPGEEASNCNEEFIVMKLQPEEDRQPPRRTEEIIVMKLQPEKDRQPPRRNEDFTAKKLPPECLVKARAPPRLLEHPPPLLDDWQPEVSPKTLSPKTMAPPRQVLAYQPPPQSKLKSFAEDPQSELLPFAEDTSFAAEDPSQIELYQSFAKDLPSPFKNAIDPPPSHYPPPEIMNKSDRPSGPRVSVKLHITRATFTALKSAKTGTPLLLVASMYSRIEARNNGNVVDTHPWDGFDPISANR